MARTPKPWYWKERREWYVTIRGERHRLGPDRKAAKTRFHALMAQLLAPPKPVSSNAIVVLIDQFLDWVQKNQAVDTFVWYQSRLQRFADHYPDLILGELRKYHVWLVLSNTTQLVTDCRAGRPRATHLLNHCSVRAEGRRAL